jgi:threonylcarbamoyladenosine tRNA methylthiotransferase MtaB
MNVFLRTFGCRANHYDSETARAMIESAGHRVVTRASEADVAVFNSCAVTSDAEADLRKAVRRAARERPQLRSVVMGCASSPTSRGSSGIRSLPTVEHLVAGADMEALADALRLPPSSAIVRAARQTTSRALLRIQDGCDEHCTFCATTRARGANRSRPATELVEEAGRLAERHPEIVLTGIHIGSYGCDIGSSLGELLERLVAEVSHVRFRLSSLEATEVDDRLFALLSGDSRRVAPHLHAPLQSGSDTLLKRMGRHWYTAAAYARTVERLAASSSVFALGADIIAGFPGETEADHRGTLAFVEELPFTYLHVFPFSLRPGTAAERLGGQVPGDVAARRARELRALGQQKAAVHRAARAGGIADVVVVSRLESEEREGLTEDYLTVRPSDPSLPRGARFAGTLALDGDRLVAVRLEPGT